ncbi:starvation-inducible DNA-binding protein [Catalinimonas alkaloidigena]|uniref:Starvation-inducible DNA-binding protein n=1 Tax=Catalinimonas alkaloidigena TaxID=1075417 RepID=A0A1G9P685_9BACT|nr:DNA starvation/stationary phase protection protein [Catalinimonas alkaloidigena]SDL94250.1 starvation-inducible DNA-binding protein [Catalinimonas alkaloidigena]
METITATLEERTKEVAYMLNTILADEYVLYTKTRHAHWNVEGGDFQSLHLFFETQYRQLDALVDDVAERIRTIGHYVPAHLKMFLQETHFTEQETAANDGKTYLGALLSDHEALILHFKEILPSLEEKYRDLGTASFVSKLLEVHEKMAWMLRAHLR